MELDGKCRLQPIALWKMAICRKGRGGGKKELELRLQGEDLR